MPLSTCNLTQTFKGNPTSLAGRLGQTPKASHCEDLALSPPARGENVLKGFIPPTED